MATIGLDLGIPQLFHKWGDARNRRKVRRLQRKNRELEARADELKGELKDYAGQLRAARATIRRHEKRAAKSSASVSPA